LTVALVPAMFNPLRDKSYQDTALGPAIVDFLAWLELGGARPSTLDGYERDLSRGALLYPAHKLDELGDAEVLQIARAFPAKSRKARMAAWKSMYRWARRTRRAQFNPCEALPDFKPAKRRVYDVFSEPEVGLLCDLPLRDGALMQLMFDAGLRKGECRRFLLSHLRLDGERALVVVLGGKGDKDRELPASAAIVRKVSELALLDGLERNAHLWYGVLRTPHLERIKRGSTIGEGTFARWWDRCLKDAGVRYRNPHMARHTFATRYLRGGGTLERLSLAMGHESIRTTMDEYGHLVTADLYDEFDRVFAVTNQSDRGE
jgi:integrase